MAKTSGDYPIPFDNNGNQKHYPDTWGGIDWKPNENFEDTLTYETYSRGRSAAYFHFKRSDGRGVTMFLKELQEAIPHMVNGKLTGTFRFVKRGENYGCTLIKVH